MVSKRNGECQFDYTYTIFDTSRSRKAADSSSPRTTAINPACSIAGSSISLLIFTFLSSIRQISFHQTPEYALNPPSTGITTPVTNELADESVK